MSSTQKKNRVENKKKLNTDSKNSSNNTFLIYILLVVTFIIFSNTLNNGFTNRDDDQYITGNALIQNGTLQGFLKLFTTPYSWNYHPLTALSNWIEYKFWKFNPKPYHFFNILLHLLNVLLVYRFIFLLKKNIYIALLVALLFAIHPMHVESVAWLSERKDLLYTLFALLSLIQYSKYTDSNKRKYVYLALIFFLLSLLSKSAAVIVPILYFLIDFYRDRKLSIKLVIDKIPFFVLSLLFGIIALYSQKTAIQYAPDYTFVERFFLINYSFLFYIFKAIIPINLACLYPYPYPEKLTIYYYLSPILVGIIVFLCIKTHSFKKEIVFGILFYLIAIILVIQILPVGDAVVSERYSYLSYIGLFFIGSTFYIEKILFTPGLKKYAQPILICCILALCYQTWNRNKVWKDSITLWEDEVTKEPDATRAYFGLGNARAMHGDYNGAIEAYNVAIILDTNLKELYHNRSNAYRLTQKWNLALADLSTLITKWPDKDVYSARASIESMNKEWKKAIEDLDKAILLDSSNYEFYLQRALAEYNLKDFEGAIKDYSKALKFQNDAQIRCDRGIAYYYISEKQKACEDWRLSAEAGYERAREYISEYCK